MKTLITLFPVLLLCCCSSEEEREIHHPLGSNMLIINDPFASAWRELGAYDGNKSVYNVQSIDYLPGELDRNSTTVSSDWLRMAKVPNEAAYRKFIDLVEVGDKLEFLPLDPDRMDVQSVDMAEALTGSVTITRLFVSRDFRLVVIETENDKGEVHTHYTRTITEPDHERELQNQEEILNDYYSD